MTTRKGIAEFTSKMTRIAFGGGVLFIVLYSLIPRLTGGSTPFALMCAAALIVNSLSCVAAIRLARALLGATQADGEGEG